MRKLQVLMLVAALLVALPAYSQTVPTSTTLSAAVTTQNATRISVTSATGFVASTGTLDYGVFIDREFMRITGVSGTTITVMRGQANTRASTHGSGARVWVGRYGSSPTSGTAGGGPFVQSPLYGSCTASQQAYLPVIQVNANATDGQAMYNCNNGQWEKQNLLDDYEPTVVRYCMPEGVQALGLLTTNGNANAPLVIGNNQTPVAGSVYYGTIFLPQTKLLTGISVLNGTVAGTDTLTAILYRADGTPMAYSAQTTASGVDRFQDLAFSVSGTATPFLATGPARYWVGLSASGTTTRFRNINLTPGATTAGLGAFYGMYGSSATFTYGLVGTATLLVLGPSANPVTGALPTSLISVTAPVACIY